MITISERQLEVTLYPPIPIARPARYVEVAG
jgi:hypothetical protein